MSYLFKLQQYLPLAVLKHIILIIYNVRTIKVATVLTACGIETYNGTVEDIDGGLQQYLPLAVLKLII